MFRTIAMTRGALALLLASAVAGAAEAQTAVPNSRLSCRCTGAPFTLSDGIARFHVALDDNSSEPSVTVVMKFINAAGTVVKAGTATIRPGGSATLEYRAVGTGLYRVQAEAFESLTTVTFSERRTVVSSLEQQIRAVGQASSGPGLPADDVIFQWIGPGPIVPCKTFTSIQ